MPNEQRLRQMIQEELVKYQNTSRFSGVQSIPNHSHDGINSAKIKAESIIPSTSVTGFVSFATANTYTLNLNSSFTPRMLTCYGIVTGTLSGNQTRVMTYGTALFTPTFYFQQDTSRTVNTGNLQFPFKAAGDTSLSGKPAQSSSFISVTRGGTSDFYAGVSEDHIVSINIPTTSTIQARATVVDFSRNAIVIDIPILTNGWEITLNFVIS